MNHFVRKICVLMLVSMTASLLWFGCSDDDSTSPTPVVHDPEKADSIVTAANDSLAVLMDEVVNQTMVSADSSFRPGDIDFTGLYAMYKNAYILDPANYDARFGVSFCGIMSFLANPDLNDLIDDVKSQYDNNDSNPFNPGKMIPRILTPEPELSNGIPASPGSLVEFLPDIVGLNSVLTGYASTDSTMSRLQRIIENSLLPLLGEAANHLKAIIAAEPPFTFTITPAMQGNDGAQQIIIDRSDFQIFLGTVHAFEAVLHIVLARYLDVDIWSMENLEADINKGSDFLKLRPGDHMPLSKAKLLEAADDFYAAADFLLDEIGTSQTYDLIPVYADDEDDLQNIKNGIMEFTDYFEGVRDAEIVYNEHCYWVWNGSDYYYECFADTLSATVDISQLFDNPVQDLKELLPDYTITLDADTEYYKTFAAEHFSPARYWANLQTYFGIEYPNDTSMFSAHLPDDSTSDLFYDLIYYYDNDYYHFVLGWDDVTRFGSNIYDFYARNMWRYCYYYNNPYQVASCFIWDADSFDAWTWPNPTLNGLFPQLTSNEIKGLLQMQGIEWDKSSCGIIDVNEIGFYLR